MTMVSIGEFGKYQRRIFILLCLVGIPFSIFDTGPVFWADFQQYKCNDTRMVQYNKGNHYLTNLNNNTVNVNVTRVPQDSDDGDDDVDEKKKVNLKDMFNDIPAKGCYLIAQDDTDDANTTLVNAPNEKQYCANYSFEVTGVSMVSRVSTAILTVINTYDALVMIRVDQDNDRLQQQLGGRVSAFFWRATTGYHGW